MTVLNIHEKKRHESLSTMLRSAYHAANASSEAFWRAANERADLHGEEDEDYIWFIKTAGALWQISEDLKAKYPELDKAG